MGRGERAHVPDARAGRWFLVAARPVLPTDRQVDPSLLRAVNRLLILFVALALVVIVPVWSVKYIPAGDGPSHVYNAWVLHGLLTGDAPANIEAAYRIDWRPHPNWTGHAFMALAMFVVP